MAPRKGMGGHQSAAAVLGCAAWGSLTHESKRALATLTPGSRIRSACAGSWKSSPASERSRQTLQRGPFERIAPATWAAAPALA